MVDSVGNPRPFLLKFGYLGPFLCYSITDSNTLLIRLSKTMQIHIFGLAKLLFSIFFKLIKYLILIIFKEIHNHFCDNIFCLHNAHVLSDLNPSENNTDP